MKIAVLALCFVALCALTAAQPSPHMQQAAAKGDWKTVERLAQQTLLKHPTDRMSALLLALSLSRQSKHSEAIAACRKVYTIDPNILQVYLIESEAQSALKQSDDAIATLQRAQKQFPDSVQPTWALGMAYARNGRCDAAIGPLEEAMYRRPQVAGITEQLARCYFALSRFEESAELFARLVDLQPSSAPYRLRYAEALMASRKFEEAVYEYEAARKLDPSLADAYLGQAAALQEMGRTRNALQVSRELVSRLADNAMAWYNVGLLHIALDEPDSATRALKKAVALKPNYAEAYFNLGVAYDMRGFTEDAVMSFKRSASMNAGLAPDAYNSIAIMHRKAGKVEEAVAMHRQAITLRDTAAVLYVSLMNTYYEGQQCTKATELGSKMLEKFPQQAEVIYSVARCLVRTGDREKARSLAQQLQQLQPEYAEQVELLMKY